MLSYCIKFLAPDALFRVRTLKLKKYNYLLPVCMLVLKGLSPEIVGKLVSIV